MREIKLNGETVAIFHKAAEWKEGLDFLTPQQAYIQAGTWWYQAGKELRPHRHIKNERKIALTQEVIIILTGRIRIDLYNCEKNIFLQEELEKGDIAIFLNVAHGYQILENDTRIVEVKNGPFISLDKDKELI